ncbi:hypothetical protein ACFFLH_17285, partial [Balneatrix alpica]
NGSTIQEGEYAIFTVNVSGAATGSTLKLALPGTGSATLAQDYEDALEYSLDAGNTWTAYPAAGITGLPEGDSSLKVRVKTLTDTDVEGAETFNLRADLESAGTTVSGEGSATILDTTVSVSPAVDANGSTIQEGEYAIFTVNVSGAATGSTLKLALPGTGSATLAQDYEDALEYSLDAGNTWTAYPAAGITGLPEGDSSLKVRVKTLTD